MSAVVVAIPTRPCADCQAPIERRHARYCDVCRIAHRQKPLLRIPTLEIDEMIRAAYRRFWEFNSRKAIKVTAAKIGWPDWAVKRRARTLGLSRTSENTPWTKREEEILHVNGHHSDDYIVRKLREAGFYRTPTAVHLKCKRERLKPNLDGYSGCQLADGFGVDPHKVTYWINRGLLKAERREMSRTPQQGGNPWWIRRDDVRRFVFQAPDEIDLKKVEKWWFLDLLTDGAICR